MGKKEEGGEEEEESILLKYAPFLYPLTKNFKRLHRVRSKRSHSSLFFLGGIFCFGLAAMIYYGITLGKDVKVLMFYCGSGVVVVDLINQFLVIGFIFMQTYFIFCNYHMNFVTSKSLMRMGVQHVISTNICMTLGALMQETLHTVHKVHDHDEEPDYTSNATDYTSNATESVCDITYYLTKTELKIAHYLLPAVIEHGILSTYVLYSIKGHIGKIPEIAEHHHKSLRKKFDLIGSKKGFSSGLLVFIMAFVNIILFLMVGEDYESNQMEIPHIIILLLMIISTFIGFYRIKNLRIQDHGATHEVTDNVLLRLALCGAYLFYVLMIVAGFLSDSSVDMILTSTVGILNIVQLTQQIFFMYDITYRILDYPTDGSAQLSPGRNTVTFLCLCNFTIWIIHTFQAEKYCNNPIPNAVYGKLPWVFMVRSALPLMIFFRFHSIDVIGKIWNEVYRTVHSEHTDEGKPGDAEKPTVQHNGIDKPIANHLTTIDIKPH